MKDSDYGVSLSRLLQKVMIQRESSNVNFHAAWHVIMNRTMVEGRVLENFGVYCDAVLSYLNTNQGNEVVA